MATGYSQITIVIDCTTTSTISIVIGECVVSEGAAAHSQSTTVFDGTTTTKSTCRGVTCETAVNYISSTIEGVDCTTSVVGEIAAGYIQSTIDVVDCTIYVIGEVAAGYSQITTDVVDCTSSVLGEGAITQNQSPIIKNCTAHTISICGNITGEFAAGYIHSTTKTVVDSTTTIRSSVTREGAVAYS